MIQTQEEKAALYRRLVSQGFNELTARRIAYAKPAPTSGKAVERDAKRYAFREFRLLK